MTKLKTKTFTVKLFAEVSYTISRTGIPSFDAEEAEDLAYEQLFKEIADDSLSMANKFGVVETVQEEE